MEINFIEIPPRLFIVPQLEPILIPFNVLFLTVSMKRLRRPIILRSLFPNRPFQSPSQQSIGARQFQFHTCTHNVSNVSENYTKRLSFFILSRLFFIFLFFFLVEKKTKLPMMNEKSFYGSHEKVS
jgi:hypothetical protein